MGRSDEAGDPHDAAIRLVADADAVERALMRLMWLERKLFAIQLERFELTPAQYMVLVQLALQRPGCTMGHLATQMHQSSATMTGIVDRLVRRALAERRHDPEDRRRVVVGLTEHGKKLLAQAYDAKRMRTLDTLATFNADERERLVELLETYLARVGDGLRDAGA